MELIGEIKRIENLSITETNQMYQLMDQFYDHVNLNVFHRDLNQKDICILLRDGQGEIQGFSTQKQLKLLLDFGPVYGVFSGDTIIHPKCWGSMRLFQLFARHYFKAAEDYGEFYWFLISKGYKTYRILSSFFQEFYPCHFQETPDRQRRIMAAFGEQLYPNDYNPKTGVVEYNYTKDVLKTGIADISDRQRKDPHIAFFLQKNPGYYVGNDLVCLTQLSRDNLLPRTEKLLFGGGNT